MPGNELYYGDNLTVLRESIASESADLIYLDPPFNSQATYNVLFRSPTGQQSQAQIEAFEDTWHWTTDPGGAADAFDQTMRSGNTSAADLLRAMQAFLGNNDMMAYLAMMAIRLIELRRVLKPTGSLYLHCDPTASHYLKILLDAIFGPKYFRNELIWHYNTGGKGKSAFLKKHDVIFYYSKSDHRTFNWKEVAIQRKVGTAHLRQGVDADGREYYEDYSPRKSGKQYRWYLDEGLVPMDVWTDIQALNPAAIERLGYPTQKPVALLERIIAASSNVGDVVLDPFCGCGTTIHAAQKLGRSWVGIDITHLAISLIERRLKDAFPGIAFDVQGTPKDLEGARDLALRDKYQFQWWAVSLVDAQPYGGKKKGADSGIDGLIYFRSDAKTTERSIVSVKGGDNVSVAMVRDLKGVMNREKAPIGVFLTLAEPTRPMEREAASAGFYTILVGDKGEERQFPRLQIITIKEALAGKMPAIPLVDTGASFRRPAREDSAAQTKLSI